VVVAEPIDVRLSKCRSQRSVGSIADCSLQDVRYLTISRHVAPGGRRGWPEGDVETETECFIYKRVVRRSFSAD
jgi:hypothetical protein